MIRGREIVFAPAVAHAGFADPPGRIETQIAEQVARPAATVTVTLQALLGGKHAVAAVGRELAIEIALVAEQPEPALRLPHDARSLDDRGNGRGLRRFFADILGRRPVEPNTREQQRTEEGGTE